jgi:DNA-binding SARP family transcriptional activator
LLGNGECWHEIFDLNQGKPQPGGGALTDPGLIYPGWVLQLPPPASHKGTGPAHHSGQPAPRRTPAAPPPRAPHRENPGGAPSPAEPSAHPRQVAVHLPSGALIGISVAIMVAAALALASIQRRRRYRPAARLTASLQPDQPPLPAVITALRRAAAEASGHQTIPGTAMAPASDPCPGPYDDTSPGPGQPGEPAARTHAAEPGHQPGVRPEEPGATAPPFREPGTVPLGVRGTSETALDIAALVGLGLTGPGAPAAARAILATLLAHAGPAHAGTPPAVIVPAADLTRLLPAQHPAQIPGLSVPGSLDAALDEMETALLHHARTIGAPGTGADPQAPAPARGAPGPAAALIATPEPGAMRRLRGVLESGRGLGAAAILLGAWPPGITCHVATDGVITDVTPPGAGLEGTRLFHLGAEDAAAIAAVLGDARATPPAGPALAQPGPVRPAGWPPHGGAHRAAPAPGRYLPAPAPPATAPPLPARATATPPRPPRAAAPAGPQAGAARAADSQASDPEPARPVQLTMLGPLRITARGQEIGGGLRKARELMAFLAVHPGGASADAISEALWPDADPGHAATQRNLALRKARDMLRTATGLVTPMWILHTSGRYRLDPSLISTDLWQLTDALDQARAATGQDRLAACRTAASLYHGELADGEAYEWAEPYAETARRRALDAWTTIAGILQPSDPDQALAALESALSHDPYNEYLYQKVMRLQAEAGHLEAARRTLSLLEARLADLGITPGPHTRHVAAILLGTHTPPPGAVGSG